MSRKKGHYTHYTLTAQGFEVECKESFAVTPVFGCRFIWL